MRGGIIGSRMARCLRVYFSDEDKKVCDLPHLVDSAKNLAQHAEYVFGGTIRRIISLHATVQVYFAPKGQVARLYQRETFNDSAFTYDILLTEKKGLGRNSIDLRTDSVRKPAICAILSKKFELEQV